ncbi:hypothetical protein Scep_021834 [Stephania cephalantha]|uniref:WRKY domain-containing protein n=1 Tax=Stephania cephalantha TaxID=152367 RepID=A0AAP0F6S0_9MAGN
MEATSRASDLGGSVMFKEEKKVGQSTEDETNIDGNKSVNETKIHKEGSSMPTSTDLGNVKQEDQLESAKAEMGEVREENERLKTVLARIMKEYQSLQTHFFDIVQQEQSNKKSIDGHEVVALNQNTHQESLVEDDHQQLISLSLGRSSSSLSNHLNNQTKTKDEKMINSTSISSNNNKSVMEDEFKEGLALGLVCKVEASKTVSINSANPSPENSFEENKEEDVREQWPPSKMLKIMKSGEEEAVSQQTAMKRARVSVRARCDTPTMNDGCQWRKYGQKIAKGNPCPRAYYRCTVAPACPVRKQVQRCAEDMSILITTYEGTHNHPLPISATAMASTTSAAACMLMSGSSTSRPSNITTTATATTSSVHDLHGLNFGHSESSRPRNFYLSNNSSITSSAASHPTITLDLTAQSSSSSMLSSASQFNRFSSNCPTHHAPRYPSTFNFSSSDQSNNNSSLPISWGNGYLTYGAHQTYNKSSNNQIGALNLGKTNQQPHQDQFYSQSKFHQKTTTPPQQALSETIAAATKVITADPNFRSALASAISSIVSGGGGGGTQQGNQSVVENVIQNMKWGEQFPTISAFTTGVNANGCGSSYLNRSSSSSSMAAGPQQGSLLFLPPSLPFASSKSASASPVDNENHIN